MSYNKAYPFHYTPRRDDDIVVRPLTSDHNNIIEAELVKPTHGEQFQQAFDQPQTPQGAQQRAPRKNQQAPGSFSSAPARRESASFGHEEVFYGSEDPVENARYLLREMLGRLGHFVVIIKFPSGDLMGAFHLPIKTVAMIIFALFLMFMALYNFPGIWETFFGFFGLA